MQKVIINGKEYPIKCTIGVLEEVQEKYNTILNFEMKLAGWEPMKEPDGKPILDENGRAKIIMKDPSIRVIYDILPLMLKAGGDENTKIPELSQEYLEFDIRKVSDAMYDAYAECFERKNPSSVKGQGKETKAKK